MEGATDGAGATNSVKVGDMEKYYQNQKNSSTRFLVTELIHTLDRAYLHPCHAYKEGWG